MRHVADELRTIALDLGWRHSELINCVGIINAVRYRLAVEAGLAELRDAEAMDLRLKGALVGGDQ